MSDADLLREMVRQVLREVVPQTMATGGAALADETVVLSSDADLQAFVRRVALLCEDDDVRAALASGERRFRLHAAPSPVAASAAAVPVAPVVRVEKGAVTERHVREAAAAGAGLVLGRGAVLTPLARDRARAAGVSITKEK